MHRAIPQERLRVFSSCDGYFEDPFQREPRLHAGMSAKIGGGTLEGPKMERIS
jgi:hypothetical protein